MLTKWESPSEVFFTYQRRKIFLSLINSLGKNKSLSILDMGCDNGKDEFRFDALTRHKHNFWGGGH